MWSFRASLFVFGLHGLVVSLLGKVEAVLFQGGIEYGSILSWSGLVYLAIFCSVVLGRRLLLFGDGGKGGGLMGRRFPLHVSGSLCKIVFDIGSLLNLIAQRLMASSACSLMGGMEASISMAVVGAVLNAAQISLRARLCTFSSGFI